MFPKLYLKIRYPRHAYDDAINGIGRVLNALFWLVLTPVIIFFLLSHWESAQNFITNNKYGVILLVAGIPTVIVAARVLTDWQDSIRLGDWLPSANEWRGAFSVAAFVLCVIGLGHSLGHWLDFPHTLAGRVFILLSYLLGVAVPFLKWNGNTLLERIYFFGFNLTGQPYGWWVQWNINLEAQIATHQSGLILTFKRTADIISAECHNRGEWEAKQGSLTAFDRERLLKRLVSEGAAVYAVYMDTNGSPWWAKSRSNR